MGEAFTTKRRYIVMVVCSIILVAGAIVLLISWMRNRQDDGPARAPLHLGSTLIRIACSSTLYPLVCAQDLSSSPASSSANPRQLTILSITVAVQHLQHALHQANDLLQHLNGSTSIEALALQDCIELLDDSIDQLNNSAFLLSNLDLRYLTEQFADVKVQISSSLSYLGACEDGFFNQTGNITTIMLKTQERVAQSVTNSLYLVDSISNLRKDTLPSVHFRRLLWDEMASDVPWWLSTSDRRLLREDTSSVTYDTVVAQDGTGHYRTIQEAVAIVPQKSDKRYVIFIKEGIYKENVVLSRNLWNVMFLGEGIDKTIITGDRNVVSHNCTTYRTATLAISGKGFMAKDITFRNTAGPSGYQAVAIRVGADLTIFQTSSFEGYQDTLYALSSRQFYKGCKIYGTVDFIFGNAAAIFQDCELLARLPNESQQNTYTAQGRKVHKDVTGFSFQNCRVTAAHELKTSTYPVDSYLGRPWKQWSRAVFMKSFLDEFIHPAGWLAWNSSEPFIDTVYYGEYMNTGPGSKNRKRVNWPGVHPNMSTDEAELFSVESLFVHVSWLADARIEFEKSIS